MSNKPDEREDPQTKDDKEDDKKIEDENGSETELVTEIIVPDQGRWKWVVVAASAMCFFVTEGAFMSFGSIYMSMAEDLEIDVLLVTLANSIALSLLLLTGPVVSAFVNRYGFRGCAMTGSIIVTFAYLVTYFAQNYILLIIFYGIVAGIGACFVIMPSILVVGFYFEQLRAFATALTGIGASTGIAVMSKLSAYIVQRFGWRMVILLQTGLFGMLYFACMVYKPLLSLSVTTDDENYKSVSHLPSLSIVAINAGPSKMAQTEATTRTEKLFSAVSNVHFPTVANVMEDVEAEPKQGPAASSMSMYKFTLTPRAPQGGISQKKLKQFESIISPKSKVDFGQVTIIEEDVQPKKKRWYLKCCRWEPHVEESRPMYRDDAFYNGRVQNLPVYKEQVLGADEEEKTGLEYQMAVTRTAAQSDLEERKGVCTTAVRRVLATMLDPQLLKRISFLMVCSANFFICMGIIVPLIYVADRSESEGIAADHCSSFVSVISISGAVGRVDAGLMACKFSPIKVYICGCIASGISLILSNFSFHLYYQYCCYVLFGFATAHINTLRSPVLVDLYGLDKLTNAMGMVLMFAGFGTLISTPLSGVLKNYFGYVASFYSAGSFLVLAGVVMINVKKITISEVRKQKKMMPRARYSSVALKRKKIPVTESLASIHENNTSK